MREKVFLLCIGLTMLVGMLSAQLADDRIEIHGFIGQGYMQTTDNNIMTMKTEDGSFEFNEAAFNFSLNATEKIRGGLQILSRDMGMDGNNQFFMDWAYADYRMKDYLGVRIGKIKTPFGLHGEVRDVDALRTFILLPQSVYDENTRDFSFAYQGVSIYGNVPLKFLGDLDYSVYKGTFNIPNSNSGFWKQNFNSMSQAAGMIFSYRPYVIAVESSQVNDASVRTKYVWGGSVYWNMPLENLRIGGTYLSSELEDSGQLNMVYQSPVQGLNGVLVQKSMSIPISVNVTVKDYYTIGAEYVLDNLTLTGEYTSVIKQINTQTNELFSDPEANKREFDLYGYYGQLTYRMTSWLEIGGYYSYMQDDKEYMTPVEKDWEYYQKDYCLALRFDLSQHLLLKVEGHQIDGLGLVLDFENPDHKTQKWNMFAIKTSFYF